MSSYISFLHQTLSGYQRGLGERIKKSPVLNPPPGCTHEWGSREIEELAMNENRKHSCALDKEEYSLVDNETIDTDSWFLKEHKYDIRDI